jgi:hypothetical protein
VSYTPLYGLRKFDNGEPAGNVGVIVNEHADAIEAALQDQGVIPPDLADMLSQLSAFNALNAAGAFIDSGWINITNSGTIRTGYTPRVRRLGRLVVAEGGWTTSGQTANSSAAAGTIPATVTVGGTAYNLRPAVQKEFNPGMSSAGSLGKVIVATTGIVSTVVGGTPPGYMVLDGMTWTTD